MSNCPYCKTQIDMASNPNPGLIPQPGDVAICFHCLSVCIYDQNMEMRVMSEAEIAEMQKHPDFMEALQQEINEIRTGRFKPEDALPSLVKGRD